MDNIKAPDVIYKTTRDNADYGKFHEEQWYKSDEAYSLKENDKMLWYENEFGETALDFTIQSDWTKEDILEYYAFIFQNDNDFRE